ncbi:hybrid sensor histidine kinase/response regulator [Scytonema hofmannii PCC 7110]|uniref:histidine kinase n=1 Tax=Scytonema hofmannii PCC 7110 TaxID=128403 RepID=A0A139XBU5_9CYAN|nr:ATP-binding protein [Scytonema hofmannii]KYC42170.1 hybrid sensor histidine kinase/response regulator [Scytonema hofmannii PCC 7110]
MNDTSINILLVEDSLSDAKLLQQTLSCLGGERWQVSHFERLGDAIDACSDKGFDIALLDLSLPDSDGLNTVAEFHAAAPNIPIVVLTGFDDEEIALQAVAKRAQDYLVKGQITPQLLGRAIRYAIERGQVLKKMEESERRFRGIFEQTFQLMALLSPEGIVLEINKTTLDICGAKLEDCVGKPFWQLPRWSCCAASAWLKASVAKAADGEFIRQEQLVCGKEDTEVWIDFSLKPLKDNTGKVVLLIVEGRDISDRKRAEAEIRNAWEVERELNDLKSKFVSMVSHEFRNPMTVIRTAVEILETYNKELSDQQKGKYFGQIQTALRQMLQLLDEVLLLGRSDAGKLDYEPAALDLENFCNELVQTLQQSAGENYQINFSVQGEQPSVEMDESLLRHILTNLLSNAIKYSPKGGTIQFKLTYQGNIAHFRIQDSGIGIPLKDQQRLFETFHRASNVGRIQGTGLGLSIVKKCVDLHQGQIQLESEVGVGTAFTVTLPLNSNNTQSLELTDDPWDSQKSA